MNLEIICRVYTGLVLCVGVERTYGCHDEEDRKGKVHYRNSKCINDSDFESSMRIEKKKMGCRSK